MGFFNKILEKLGFGNEAVAAPASTSTSTPAPSAATPPPTGAAASSSSGAAASGGQAATTPGQPAGATPAAPQASAAPAAPMTTVDVVAQLEQRAAQNSQKLNWKTSIVDLLKLLDMDSSLTARKELASELGCPGNLMADSAQMNMWLHKAVLARIAANGGNVPKELLN